MKFLLLLIFVAISFVAGYLTEPSLRLQLTGIPADFEKTEGDPKPKVDDEIPFETNPVVPTTPPTVPPSDPGAPTTPEVADLNPSDTTDPATPVVPETPQTPAVTETSAPPADPVLVMKASLASGQISKFTAAQVLEWEAGTSPETIDGETYQTGTVTYQAETPFGTKNLPAKALIKDGKVVRWISPKSGMQIE
ncbi:MAG: hypothetical protein V4727_11640 [Verrucomicrobiota bacterium]